MATVVHLLLYYYELSIFVDNKNNLILTSSYLYDMWIFKKKNCKPFMYRVLFWLHKKHDFKYESVLIDHSRDISTEEAAGGAQLSARPVAAVRAVRASAASALRVFQARATLVAALHCGHEAPRGGPEAGEYCSIFGCKYYSIWVHDDDADEHSAPPSIPFHLNLKSLGAAFEPLLQDTSLGQLHRALYDDQLMRHYMFHAPSVQLESNAATDAASPNSSSNVGS